jgi:peptide/nickel transport system ATP-binding protein
LDLLRKVGIPDSEQRIDYYPHQLSGGLRQRVMIAIALSCDPLLLIADEPTTALDVTVQAQILDLMAGLQLQFHMAILYITHDLGVIAQICDRVAVMYLGRVVEEGTADHVFYNPLHPYTERLLRSIPKVGRKARTLLDAIEGTVPMPLNMPWLCGFHSRCHRVIAGVCEREVPRLVEYEAGHKARCFCYSDEKEAHHVE